MTGSIKDDTAEISDLTGAATYACTLLEDLKIALNSGISFEYTHPIFPSRGYIRKTLAPEYVNMVIDEYIKMQKYKAAIGQCKIPQQEGKG